MHLRKALSSLTIRPPSRTPHVPSHGHRVLSILGATTIVLEAYAAGEHSECLDAATSWHPFGRNRQPVVWPRRSQSLGARVPLSVPEIKGVCGSLWPFCTTSLGTPIAHADAASAVVPHFSTRQLCLGVPQGTLGRRQNDANQPLSVVPPHAPQGAPMI